MRSPASWIALPIGPQTPLGAVRGGLKSRRGAPRLAARHGGHRIRASRAARTHDSTIGSDRPGIIWDIFLSRRMQNRIRTVLKCRARRVRKTLRTLASTACRRRPRQQRNPDTSLHGDRRGIRMSATVVAFASIINRRRHD